MGQLAAARRSDVLSVQIGSLVLSSSPQKIVKP